MNPLVSIIVPIYKVPEKFLRNCIKSLIDQTLKEIEIILVDDGSPDNCGQICDEYSNNNTKIKVIHKKNGGLAAARNTGFQAAKGEYVTFVDGDDWLDIETCEIAYEAAKKNDITVVLWGTSKEYEHKSVPYTYNIIDNKIYVGDEYKELQLKLLDFKSNIATAYAKLFRRSYLVENNILHNAALRQGAEGLEFNLRVFNKLNNAQFINRSMYHYIFNENSISASHNEKNHYYVIECFKTIKEFIMSSDNRDMLLQYFYNRLLYVVNTTAISGYFSPDNTESYKEKKKKFKQYLMQELVQEALEKANRDGLSISRKLVLILIKYKVFWGVSIIAWLRRKQLKSI